MDPAPSKRADLAACRVDHCAAATDERALDLLDCCTAAEAVPAARRLVAFATRTLRAAERWRDVEREESRRGKRRGK